jgi:CelD/BcsL family acetyltransferase involved in cellulose biosynthesis
MNTRFLPKRILRRLAAPIASSGSVVFFERDLASPVRQAAPPAGFTVREGTVADLPLFANGLPERSAALLKERFDRGDLCVLATGPDGQVAHASWIALSSAWIPELQRTLTVYPGAAYGYDFFTDAKARGTGVFAAVRTFLCDFLRARGLSRLITYVSGANEAGLAGAASWLKEQGRLDYLRVHGTQGLVWGECPFTLTKGRSLPPAPRPVPAADARSLRVEVITEPQQLLAMRGTWDELVERSGIDHPFLTHDWICAWWEAFGALRELRIFAVYAGETCIAIAPLMLERARLLGIPVRTLELIGNEHTPRSGFLVSEREEEAYAALLGALRERGEPWEMVLLPRLAEDTQTLKSLERIARDAGMQTGVWRGPASPKLSLQGDWETYLKSLRPKQRTNLRNRFNRLNRIGDVQLEDISGGEALRGALDDGLRIEAAAWKGSASTAIASRPDSDRFYRRFAEYAAKRGWLSLTFLKVGGTRIAFNYGVRFRGIHYLIKQGYDPEHGAASPSQVLCSLILQDDFQRGTRAVDFLGADEPWKLEWTAESRGHSWLYLFQPGLHTWPLHFAKFKLFPALRYRWPVEPLVPAPERTST